MWKWGTFAFMFQFCSVLRFSFFFCRMAFFKCFKEKAVTILKDDSEDFEKGTTLSMHKSFTNLQSLLVLVTKDPLHVSSWSWVVYCKLTNINNSKFNKVKLVFDVVLLNSFTQPLLKVRVNLDYWVEVEWEPPSSCLGNNFLSKDIENE